VDACPVCGQTVEAHGEFPTEEERYVGGEDGAEMKIVLPYCNQGNNCSAVIAANAIDKLAEEFVLLVEAR
jgi:hypothetical protein